MRVTFCAYDGNNQINGPNVWLARTLPALRAQGFDVRVLFLLSSPPEQCPTLRMLEGAGVACRYASVHRSTGERVRWLLSELRSAPPDLFVPNVMVPAYYAARWVRAAGIPSVGILHSDDAFHHALVERFVVGLPSYRVSALACVSATLEAFAQSRVGHATPGPTTVIRRLPYGVPIPSQVASPPGEKLRLVYVGRLVEAQKRASDVARALCWAAREVPGVEGVLYGDGHARATVEAILEAEGAGRVRLGGVVPSSHVQARMLEAHAFALLSDYEGLPIALMEAMACGLVPICTPMRSGVDELIRHNENGLIVHDRGEAFVSAVRRLREEPGLWARLSEAARATIQQRYSEEVATERWAAFLRELAPAHKTSIIELPRRLDLPPSHRAFAREDHRGPPVVAVALRHGRRVLGELRHALREKRVSR